MRNGPQSPATVLRKETRGGQLPAGFSLIGSNVSSSDGSVALPMQNANDEARKIAKDVGYRHDIPSSMVPRNRIWDYAHEGRP